MKHRKWFLSLVPALFASGALGLEAPAAAWVSRGPADIGYILDLAPADGVVYAATAAGVYRTNASGLGWELSGLRSEFVFGIAARPGSPIYALVNQGGLLVSRDGGDTWDRLAANDAGLSKVVIDPDAPATAYLSSYSGIIWRTTDSGVSWKRLPPTDLSYVWAMEFDPHDHAFVVLGYSNGGGQVLSRLSDGGASFVGTPIAGHANDSLIGIGAGAATLYVILQPVNGSSYQLCRTGDGAATWTCSAVPAYFYRIQEVPAASAGATPVLIAPSDRGLFVSRDGGATWSHSDEPLATTFVLAVAFDSASGAVWAGTDSSIYRSTDRGDSWSWHGNGLRSSNISALAVDPTDATKLLASTIGFQQYQGPGLFQSSDQGQTWSLLENVTGTSGFTSLLVDPRNSSILFGAAYGGLYRSENAGESWTDLRATYWTSFLASDQRSPSTIWAADTVGLTRSDDGGRTWVRSRIPQQIYNLVFDSHDPSTLYAGSYFDLTYGYYAYPEGGSIFVSRDLGATWARGPEDLGAQPVALATDPFAGGVLYAGTNGAGFLSSGDGGRTWRKATAGSPRAVAALVADPVRPGRLYATADNSLFRSRDGGSTWEPFAEGLVAPAVSQLVITPDGRRLIAGTSGAGIFELDLGSATPSFPCAAEPGRLCLVAGRFALDLVAYSRGQWSAGAAHGLTDRAGYFGFGAVTGDATFPEIVVKMLPEGALGPGGPAIFHASLTTLPYVLTLTDTLTGQQRFYSGNQGDALCGGSDRPFPDSAAVFRPESAAAPAEAALSLLDHRFSVALHARDARTGKESNGLAVASGDRWGYFSMPDVTGDSALPEVVVKMVDFRVISGKFWLFHTGLTGFDYTLTVTDSTTGVVRTYESPGAFCGAADTEAFSDPTPGSAGPIAGDWVGAFETSDPADCHSDPAARATFSQSGSTVTGTIAAIQNTCGFGGSFEGTLIGDGITGTLTKGNFTGGGHVTGTATASSIHLRVNDLVHDLGNGTGEVIPGGTLDLHR